MPKFSQKPDQTDRCWDSYIKVYSKQSGLRLGTFQQQSLLDNNHPESEASRSCSSLQPRGRQLILAVLHLQVRGSANHVVGKVKTVSPYAEIL